MSVLRKRSPWFIPAASLLLGAMTLGLAGCGGGGDDEGFPSPITSRNIPIPVVRALTPTNVVTGQGATLTATPAAGTAGGVTQVRVSIPNGAIQENGTYAIEVVPLIQSTIEQIRQTNPSAVAGITPITELLFGDVDQNGNINTSRPIVFGGGGATITLDLSQPVATQIANAINANTARLVVRRRNAAGSDLVYVTDCTASLGANNTLVLTGNCSGDITVTLEVTHPQGQVI